MAKCSCGYGFELPSSFEATAIKCSNCGGNPGKNKTRCPYCDADLATLRCVKCFAVAVVGDRHCRACGDELEVFVRHLNDTPLKHLLCPRCGSPLQALMIGDSIIDECDQCGGIWATHDVVENVIRNSKNNDPLIEILATIAPARHNLKMQAPPRHQGDKTEQSFYIRCPDCNEQMTRRQFAKVSGVVVDSCAKHGVWFDRRELTEVIDFAESGGIQYARKVEKERQQRFVEGFERRMRVAGNSDPSTALLKILLGILAVAFLAAYLAVKYLAEACWSLRHGAELRR